jgi:hypothetical protein
MPGDTVSARSPPNERRARLQGRPGRFNGQAIRLHWHRGFRRAEKQPRCRELFQRMISGRDKLLKQLGEGLKSKA